MCFLRLNLEFKNADFGIAVPLLDFVLPLEAGGFGFHWLLEYDTDRLMTSGVGTALSVDMLKKSLLGILCDAGVEAAAPAVEDVDEPLSCHGSHYIQHNINGASKGCFFRLGIVWSSHAFRESVASEGRTRGCNRHRSVAFSRY